MLRGHPKVDTETARVSLTAILDTSIEIEVFVHVLESSNEAFLAAQEEFLVNIMDIVGANGVKFAFQVPAHSPWKEGSAHL